MARFMRKGKTRFYWCPTVANLNAPTVANITAGTRLDPQIAEINGFEFANSPIDVPDMATAFVSKIPGEDTVADSSISFYEDDTTNPIQTALAKGTVGHVVIFPRGTAGASPAVSDVTEVWPAIVASSARAYTAGNEAARYTVTFTLTAPPVTGAVAA
jgi:hypothetical protein